MASSPGRKNGIRALIALCWLVCIAWLLRYVSTRSYTPFVLYRIALGTATLILLGAGVLSA